MKLLQLTAIDEVRVTPKPLFQHFTKNVLLYDVDEDFTAREVAENLQLCGGTFALREVFRQQFKEQRGRSAGKVYKGFGVFVTYIGPAVIEEAFLMRRSLKFKAMNPGALQCRNCLRYGHSQRICRQKGARCAECSGSHATEQHSNLMTLLAIVNRGRADTEKVSAPPLQCWHCLEVWLIDTAHRANDRVCLFFKKEQDIQEEAYIRCCSRQDVIKRRSRLRSNVSFAAVAQGGLTRLYRVETPAKELKNQQDVVKDLQQVMR